MDITQIWGNKDAIAPLEITCRAAVMFLFMVVLLRVSGMRTFGKGDVFDNILSILLGAVLARGIVGATPFLSCIAAGIVITVIHVALSKLSFYSKWAGDKIKGKACLLYKDNNYLLQNMERVSITKKDIEEELHLKCQKGSMEKIAEVYLERTGEVSFIEK